MRLPLTASFAWSALVVLLLSSSPTISAAQAYPITGRPSANRFYRAPGLRYMMVDDAETPGALQPSLDLTFDYAHRPMAIDDVPYYTSGGPMTGEELDLVGGTATLQITGAIAIADRVQIGLNVPLVLHTFGSGYSWVETSGGRTITQHIPAGDGTTLGDPRLHVLVNLIDPDEASGIGLGIAAWVTAPVAHAILPDRYAGDPSVAFGSHLAFSLHIEGFRAAINLGFGYHDESKLLLSARTTEMTWGAAALYDFSEIFTLLVELTGATTFGLVFDNEAPTEIRAGVRFRAGDFTFDLGAGAGLAYAIGVPIFRILGGAAWSPRVVGDSDHDGIADDVDGCPGEGEDLDGFADEDGCPEEDDDGDQIADDVDQCPSEAEDRDDHDDEDGCPDPDDDGDGVIDGYDSCPNEPEDVDGDRDTDGCPDSDRDRDGLQDGADVCPEEAEDTDGLGDEDGCPETDFDNDGVPDDADECADRAEDRDGFQDADGCPEEGAAAGPRRSRGR
jgi:hypothetical protein